MNEEYDPVYGVTVTREVDEKAIKRRSFRHGLFAGLGIMLVFALLTVSIAGITLYRRYMTSFTEDVGAKASLIEGIISQYYYEDVDQATLDEGVYAGIVGSLGDKYSAYYTEDEYEQLNIDVTGKYGGVGMSLQQDADTGAIKVVRVYQDVPAEKAGLKAGDIILSADGNEADGMQLDVFVQFIRGEEGTDVEITYMRDGEEYTTVVTREIITLPSVYSHMESDGIGYIQITEFMSNTAEEFKSAVDELTAQGMTSLIIDLRDNPGGLLDVVVNIADEILPKGTVVYMEDKNGKRTTYTSDAEHYMDIPIVVLINKNSASASEILAGALRDYGAAVLLGTTTFGKGVVQTTLPLTDGSAVKLTIATYYTPSGECIHGTGISPDFELEYEYTGEGTGSNYEYDKDNQVVKAVELLGAME